MRAITRALRGANTALFKLALLACLIFMSLVLATQIGIVLMRYVMGVGFLELQDLVTYAFGAMVVLSVPLAFRKGRHVRVDVIRNRMGPRAIAWVERVGALVLILPVFGLLMINAWPLVSASFAILEGSRETGGLGGLYLVKGTVIVMCVMVILLAIGTILEPGAEDGE